MRTKLTIVVVAFLVCCIVLPLASAQGKCSMETLAGTYVMYERGANSYLNPTPNEQAPLHFVGATAPFVNVGQVTFNSYGEAEGFYWIKIGTMDGGLEPIPVHVNITELNEDCTGIMEYEVNLPPIPATTITERIVFFDNGREFRSVPISMGENGVPTLAWMGYGRRIETPCTGRMPRGTYMLTCENLIAVAPDIAVADSTIFRLNVADDGSYAGRLFEKIGDVSINTRVVGAFTPAQSCSFNYTLQVPDYFGTATIDARGVYFNDGKEFYLLPMVGAADSGFCQGKRVGP